MTPEQIANIQARDELKKTIYQSHRGNTQVDLQNDRRLQGSQLAWAGFAGEWWRWARERPRKSERDD